MASSLAQTFQQDRNFDRLDFSPVSIEGIGGGTSLNPVETRVLNLKTSIPSAKFSQAGGFTYSYAPYGLNFDRNNVPDHLQYIQITGSYTVVAPLHNTRTSMLSGLVTYQLDRDSAFPLARKGGDYPSGLFAGCLTVTGGYSNTDSDNRGTTAAVSDSLTAQFGTTKIGGSVGSIQALKLTPTLTYSDMVSKGAVHLALVPDIMLTASSSKCQLGASIDYTFQTPLTPPASWNVSAKYALSKSAANLVSI